MTGTPDGRRPLALVYRGPTALPGCPEAVADLLASGPWRLDVRVTGPREALPMSAESLSGALLYAQPGGGELDSAYHVLRPQHRAIRAFVQGGGHYLGSAWAAASPEPHRVSASCPATPTSTSPHPGQRSTARTPGWCG